MDMPTAQPPINVDPAIFQACEDYSNLMGLAHTSANTPSRCIRMIDAQERPSNPLSHAFKTTLFATLTHLHGTKRPSRMALSRACAEVRRLRIQNNRLQVALRKKEEEVEHLRCDICHTNIKGVLTPCGHGFCEGCFTRWLQQRDFDKLESEGFVEIRKELEGPCPTCRLVVRSLTKCYLSTGDNKLEGERTEDGVDDYGFDDEEVIEETQDD